MINIAVATVLFVLGALIGALAWRKRARPDRRVGVYRQRPRCAGCGAPLPPELVDASACYECLDQAISRIAALTDWRSLTPDADRLLRQLDARKDDTPSS